MVAAVLIFGGALAIIYYLSQQGAADAPGHCGGCTVEQGQRLSFDELLSLAQDAGFDADSQTAAAIALAESGGNTKAYNPEPQDVPGKYNRASVDDGLGSYGLWQIYRAAHPEYEGVDLTDKETNAEKAYEIYSKRGFNQWSSFSYDRNGNHMGAGNGYYREFLPA